MMQVSPRALDEAAPRELTASGGGAEGTGGVVSDLDDRVRVSKWVSVCVFVLCVQVRVCVCFHVRMIEWA